jgi:hypothetical protein
MDINQVNYKSSAGNLTADTWTYFEHYFVPTGTTVYFGGWIRTAGTVHFDDWSVKAVTHDLVSYWALDVDGSDSHGDNDGTLT